MDNPLGYPALVWRLFRETPRAGELASGVVFEVGTPAASSRLRLQVRVDDGVIVDTAFRALGCPYTVATGAWLARWLLLRPPADCARPPFERLRAELESPPDRAHCWLMAQDVLGELHRTLATTSPP